MKSASRFCSVLLCSEDGSDPTACPSLPTQLEDPQFWRVFPWQSTLDWVVPVSVEDGVEFPCLCWMEEWCSLTCRSQTWQQILWSVNVLPLLNDHSEIVSGWALRTPRSPLGNRKPLNGAESLGRVSGTFRLVHSRVFLRAWRERSSCAAVGWQFQALPG